ncbi:MAG: hypothetical protein JETCAE03_32430 [Ignavibacteriaceae bacterium]|nr:MAG: hypothetical protein JETCAE03_32430 [Ignavibacteriaceae bacterium]
MSELNIMPPWNELKNETLHEYNDFNIFRGRQFMKIGKDVWVGVFCLIDGSGGLTIGNHVSISSGVHIYTHDSSYYRIADLAKDTEFGTHIKRAPVRIGNNVQIGANSIILPGVTIGDNVIIGALSLVKTDIPSRCVAVGNPCKVIKTFFNQNEIERKYGRIL